MLFDLIVCLRQAELRFSTKLLVTHVVSIIITAQGTDGLSRDSFKSGVATGEDMIKFCPWRKSAIEAESILRLWVITWLPKETVFLEPKDWFTRGYDTA